MNFRFAARILSVAFTLGLFVFADGTRTWEQSKFDELVKGTPDGVAIRSNGGLELAPSFKLLYATPSTYIWAVAADEQGNVYAATGSPARVYRITPAGTATIIFEAKELQVQAVKVGPGGVIYAGTAPDGKVYKIEPKSPTKGETKAEKKAEAKEIKADEKSADKDAAKPTVDAAWTSSEYFAPGTKYIWDLALDRLGTLYVATGDHGEIYKVTAKGEHSLFFKSDETHVRVLAFDPQGNVIAGTDGSGLVYRISPAGEGFVLYSAPKKEITALALDRDGNIYAAGVGEKHVSAGASSAPMMLNLPSSPVPSALSTAPGVSITMTQPTAPVLPIPIPGSGASGGGDVYRIAVDGSPSRIWSSHEDIVYALAFDSQGRLLAGTGNRGHIFSINGAEDYCDLLKAPASQIVSFAKAPDGGLYAASSNLGKLFVLGPKSASEGAYLSDVFDAKIFSRWGRAEFRGSGNVELLARSGNVDNPDRNWSAWKPVDLAKDRELSIPAARYMQWKVVMHAGAAKPVVDSVTVNYLSKNVAPEIDDVSVQVGMRYQSTPKPSGMNLGDLTGGAGAHFDTAPAGTHDRDSIGVKWTTHDENDDQLVYSVFYRGDGQTRWLLLKDDITDKAYSFDASLLPDGGYTIKVIASDAPSHSPGEGLTASRESRRFEVDTTPPRIENLTAAVETGQIHVRFRAVDTFSSLKRAEYSIDAGEWKYVEPVGQLSDSKSEDYDFKAAVSGGSDATAEHVVVVRAFDKYDNLGAAKILVKGN